MNPFLLPDGASYTRRSRKPIVLAVTTALVLFGGGAGFAAWQMTTTTGSTASATTVSARQLTVTGPATVTGDLYPSSAATGSLQLSLTNPNPFDVLLTSGTVGAAEATGIAGCPGTSVTTTGTLPGLSIRVPAGTTSANPHLATLPGVVTLPLTAPNECQGVTFTFPVSLTGAPA